MKLTGLLLIGLIAGAACSFAQGPSDPPDDSLPASEGIVVEPGQSAAITGEQRLAWFARSTFGPTSLFAGAMTSGIRTGLDHPNEYGTHWEGFGERYAVREAGVFISNGIEASLGAVWHEDPRYHRAGDEDGFGSRIGHVVKWTFVAPNANGELRPAYARYIGVVGSSFISEAYRVPSEDTTSAALDRIGTSFLSRIAGNAFKEFMPDVKKKFFHH